MVQVNADMMEKKLLIKLLEDRLGQSEKCFTEETFRAKVLDIWVFKQQLHFHYSGNIKVHERNS